MKQKHLLQLNKYNYPITVYTAQDKVSTKLIKVKSKNYDAYSNTETIFYESSGVPILVEREPSGMYIIQEDTMTESVTAVYVRAYLDFWDDFLTVERYAENYGISIECAQMLIDEGRKAYNGI